MPGLLVELQRTVPPALRDRLEDLTTLPQEFRNWVLMNLDSEGSGILDASSDRMWEEDSSGRSWFMSVQHVEIRNGQAQLVTDLADRPMLATQLLYHDIPCHWNLSPVALATQDCVPLSLCEALGTNFAQTKRRLCELALANGADPTLGFRRPEVIAFLTETTEGGKAYGWKVFGPGGAVLSERRAEPGGTFLSFCQKGNHLFLYALASPMNGSKSCQKKPVFVGLRQHMRSLSEIPAELRTKGLEDPPPSLALWQLKSDKKQKTPEESELLPYSGLQPGVFFSDNLQALHWQFLQEDKAPLVQLSALLKVSALVLSLIHI